VVMDSFDWHMMVLHIFHNNTLPRGLLSFLLFLSERLKPFIFSFTSSRCSIGGSIQKMDAVSKSKPPVFLFYRYRLYSSL
ncbi:MAG: hypothetical protein WB815_04240, partial [Nitrososphaeraceae archaeon]